jgi:hypothetical protein
MQPVQMFLSLLRINLRWILIAILLVPQLSYAATIGSVVLQEGITSVEREGTESDLNLESGIMFMDNVKTGKGELGITFIDDTNVAVSSQSSLIIDDFVYDPNNAEGSKLVLKVAAGTVRYASGNIAKLNKQNVDIRTPTAKIAVRGTAFSMTVDEIGQSLIILLPNADGSVGEISVESDIGQVVLTRAFQATSVRSRETNPTPPKMLDLTESMINNMLIIRPPKEKVDLATAALEEKKKKNLANFLDEEKEIDKNCLEEECEGQEEEGGFTSLDINPLDVSLLLNVLTELNKKYKRPSTILTRAISNTDGRVAGYNPETLVTTLIEGDTVQMIREYDSSIIDITLDIIDGHKINIDQKGSVVPEIRTDEAGYTSTIDINIQ